MYVNVKKGTQTRKAHLWTRKVKQTNKNNKIIDLFFRQKNKIALPVP